MKMKITIETIQHKQQRYPTVGDWFFSGNGDLHIKVSDLGDWRYNALIAVHELVEVLICKHNGVSQGIVDDFDINFEANRKPGDESEPGDHPNSPYQREHCIATAVERLLCAELEVKWEDYASAVEKLP